MPLELIMSRNASERLTGVWLPCTAVRGRPAAEAAKPLSASAAAEVVPGRLRGTQG